jgi:hypothetical protein
LAVRTGRASGDLTHPLPYCPEFFKPEFTSQVADMKNSVKDRSNAQAACAGQFIGNHIEVGFYLFTIIKYLISYNRVINVCDEYYIVLLCEQITTDIAVVR